MIRQANLPATFSLATATGSTQENPPGGTSWPLEPEPSQITIDFAAEDNAASGWTGCNRYSGSYRAGEQPIDLFGLFCTKAGCPS